nr:AraC family transcriptional regulator [Sinosporangium album]
MDPLSRLLTHPRASCAFSLLMTMRTPWAVNVNDRAPLTLVLVTRGACRLAPDNGADSELLTCGDVALVKGPHPYRVTDAEGSDDIAIIDEHQRCRSPTGEPLDLTYRHGLRHWGNDSDGPDQAIVASYTTVSSVGERILNVLPTVVKAPSGTALPGLIGVLLGELHADSPGQTAMLDRLIDAITITTVRTWATTSSAGAWLAGIDDEPVRMVLDVIHTRPEQRWTLNTLAAHARVSRSGLAARFTAQIGTPPMTYLTRWRLSLARDMLTDPYTTLDTIAARVGYSSAYSLSTAFTREYRTSPSAYRRTLTT